jgi:flavin reductase
MGEAPLERRTTGTAMPISDDFRRAMRQLAASVTVVTTRSGDVRGGLTMTAVCSVSMSPPTMLICVNRSSASHSLIANAGSFAVNILNEKQRPVAEAFAGREQSTWDERFETGNARWQDSDCGVPILSEARANIICRIRERVESGSHTIFFGEVTECRVDDSDTGHALLYSQGDYRGVSDLIASI